MSCLMNEKKSKQIPHTMLEILFTTQAVAATAVLAAFFACAIKFAEIAIKEAKKS